MKNSILFFVGLASLMLALVYVIDMPTERRMDFVLLSATIGTAFVLSLTAVFRGAMKLIRLLQVVWIIIAGIAALAILVLVGWSLWKAQLPFFSQQWYAVLILLGMIGLPGSILLGKSYDELWAEAPATDSAFHISEDPQESSENGGFTSRRAGINIDVKPAT